VHTFSTLDTNRILIRRRSDLNRNKIVGEPPHFMVEFANFTTQGLTQILCLSVVRHNERKASHVSLYDAHDLEVTEHPRENPNTVVVLEK